MDGWMDGLAESETLRRLDQYLYKSWKIHVESTQLKVRFSDFIYLSIYLSVYPIAV